MTFATRLFLLLAIAGISLAQQRSLSAGSRRRNRLPAGKSAVKDFSCPEDFGYYQHSTDCTQYYVCVFGGALLESCTGGLVYSNDLQTCDWPRNVVCNVDLAAPVSTVRVTDPRTSQAPTPRRPAQSLTPSVSSGPSIPSSGGRGGKQNVLSGPSSSSVNRQGRTSQDKTSQQSLRRFQVQESTNRAVSVSPTTTRSFSFPPPLPSPFGSSSPNRPTPTRVVPDPVPNIPTFSSASINAQRNPASQPDNPPPAIDDNYYSDLLNLTDAEYFYLYEDLLGDYFDSGVTTTTKRPIPIRQKTQTKSSGSASNDKSRPSRLTLKPVSEIVKKTTPITNNIWKYPPRRPAPLYPQPPVSVKATKCDRKACRLPDCFCGGKEVPGGVAPQNVPQMILLTFDDSVNDLNKELYQELFERGRTNPNGCPIAATFYISHEWTDYSQVQNLYADGHEIASHSITHSFGEQFSKLKWAKEIAGQREIMSAYGAVRMEDIRGMRAPFLSVGGNKMFEMLYEQNFTYDSSMPVYENRPPSYPYTLDYKMFHDCMIPPCPTNSFPGLWEVPMVMWQDLNGGRCSMGDACTTPPDAEGVYQMLIKNFERHYTTNRAPMGLFYHAAWFTTAHHKEGFIAFLDTITNMPDVWLVTNWQAIQWVRDPVPISQASSYKPFQCSYPERPARCNSHRVCNIWHKGGVRYMRTCQRCPEAYPWVGRTGVNSPLND